jgi:uroporphyrinogen-III decarboxylase
VTTSRERMATAMRGEVPDRVPVMCQLALGHYFLHSGLDPVDVWHDGPTFAEALVRLQERYGFDGILVNLPGRDPEWRRHLDRIEEGPEGARSIVWHNGWVTQFPPDDNPHVYRDDGTRFFPNFAGVDPGGLHYVEPHDLSGITWPWTWGFDEGPPSPGFFPPWQDTTLRHVRDRAPDVSVHGEVFSPFSQLMELLNFEAGLIALVDEPEKVEACLAALTEGTIELMGILARAGADAILVSSAFAGAGFISPAQYSRFVLPFEGRAIRTFQESFPDVPVYTHTCGAIGDRLELMIETGTRGIDTLDPPPLGNVELADARQRLGPRVFIKGNIDPVGTMLQGTPEDVRRDAQARIAVAGPGSYILSTACSVAPATPPENIAQLRVAAST